MRCSAEREGDTYYLTGEKRFTTFGRTPVPVVNRLGDEGQGLDVAFGCFLTQSRIAIAATCVGLARRAQELAVAHARSRTTFGKPLASRQAIAFLLAENATDIEATRQLALHAGRRWEAGDPFPELSANISLTSRPRLRASRAAGDPAVPLSRTDAGGIRPPP
ncbi:MAG: acyl-CoA dehydrogenase family protein, partial [Acidimicrobiales bacterium]